MADSSGAVSSIINNAQANANSLLANGQQFLQTLLNVATNTNIPYIHTIHQDDTHILPPSVSINLPQRPDFDNITQINIPQLNIDDIQFRDIPNFDIPNISDFTLEDIPEIPINLDIEFPNQPTINDIAIPEAPNIDLPNVPTFQPIPVPDSPAIDNISFNELAPNFDIPDIHYNFDYNEQDYQSDLKDSLKSNLKNSIDNGGTALKPDIEQAIFDRQRERDEQTLNNTIDKTIELWASRGFNLPSGMLEAELNKIMLDYQHSMLDRSREIAIKQAELEQDNIKNALAIASDIEKAELQFANEIRNRAFQTARSISEFTIAFYNAKVNAFQMRLETFKSKILEFETKIKNQLNKLELYRSQLEAARTKASLNEQQVELYKSQVLAAQSLINIYRTKMEAAQIAAQLEQSKINSYRSLIEGYTARINAEISKVNVYNAKINAQRAKAEAYQSYVNGINTRANIERTKIEANMQYNTDLIRRKELQLEEFKSKLEAEVKKYEGQIEKIRSLTQIYSADASIYETAVRGAASFASVDIEYIKSVSEKNRANLQLALEQAKANLAAFIEITRIRETAAKGGSDIYANMASAALNALNAIAVLASETQTNL